jgi:hypothetical protein
MEQTKTKIVIAEGVTPAQFAEVSKAVERMEPDKCLLRYNRPGEYGFQLRSAEGEFSPVLWIAETEAWRLTDQSTTLIDLLKSMMQADPGDFLAPDGE